MPAKSARACPKTCLPFRPFLLLLFASQGKVTQEGEGSVKPALPALHGVPPQQLPHMLLLPSPVPSPLSSSLTPEEESGGM